MKNNVTMKVKHIIYILLLQEIIMNYDSCIMYVFNCSFSGRYDFNVFDASKISVRERRPGLRGSTSVFSCLRGDASYLASYFPRVVRLYNELPVIARAPLPI
jgi:hypothetical protein